MEGLRHEIVVAPDLLSLLEIRWPPFYVLIDSGGTNWSRESSLGPAKSPKRSSPT